MMRIISGSARGRKIIAPDTPDTRPITDKARESLFNILGDIEDLDILDAYAGSGSVGLEAISRGASRAEGIEMSRQATQAIEANVKHLGFEAQYKLFHGSVERWLDISGDSFNIVFADPPFDALNVEVLERLSKRLKKPATFVLKHSRWIKPPTLEGLEIKVSRRYGDSMLTFYQ